MKAIPCIDREAELSKKEALVVMSLETYSMAKDAPNNFVCQPKEGLL